MSMSVALSPYITNERAGSPPRRASSSEREKERERERERERTRAYYPLDARHETLRRNNGAVLFCRSPKNQEMRKLRALARLILPNPGIFPRLSSPPPRLLCLFPSRSSASQLYPVSLGNLG